MRILRNIIKKLTFLLLICCYHSVADDVRVTEIQAELKVASNPTQRVDLLIELAEITVQHNVDRAIEYGEESLSFSQKLGLPSLEAKSLLSIGESYFYKGSYEQAIIHFFSALKLYEQLDEPRGLANSYGNIGLNYTYINDFALSERYLNKSVSYFDKFDDVFLKSSIYFAMARLYRIQKKLKLNEEVLFQALELLKDQKETHHYAIALGSMARLQFNKKDFKQAISFYKQSLDISLRLGLTTAIISAEMKLSQSYLELNDIKSAKAHAFIAYDRAKEINTNRDLSDTSRLLSELHEKINKPTKALDYYKLYIQYKDKQFNAVKAQQIAEVQTKYDSDKKDVELKLNQEVINNQKNINLAITVLMLLFALSAFITFQYYRIRTKANALLEYQAVELIKAKNLAEENTIRLEHIARTDGLTQLNNRQYWEDCLEQEFYLLKRNTNRISSIIIFDIDHFKQVNDNFGHLAGDQVLKHVAEVLRKTIRKTDIEGRYGGEEFGVLLIDTALKYAKIVAESIRKAIGSTVIEYNGHSIQVTVSLGVAEYTSQLESHSIWIDQADKALYSAKDSGRNISVTYRNHNE